MTRPKSVCVCGHWLSHHSATRVAGRQPCWLVGCPCDLWTEVPEPGAAEGAGEVIDALETIEKMGKKE